jgi:hypothetical protein
MSNSIKNANGKEYKVMTTDGKYALLFGDNNYIVASAITETPRGYIWAHGTYFGADIISAIDFYKSKALCKK